ncbi:MAG: molybdopterin molybdotransferase MoeA [Bacteroidales bacterium]|nr:molybdopterin molybdotransferase MoeA [Bacteroidales bacterium]
MITFEQALAIVTANIPLTDTENISLAESAGRVLAEDVLSDMDMPPFDKAAVDGFACRRADLGLGSLKIVEVIGAGIVPEIDLTVGCCSKIMTGAMVPSGADCVVMVEQTEICDAETTVRVMNPTTKNNIAFRGEDIHRGDKLLEKGILIKPQHIAVMAAVGVVNPLVFMHPAVCVMSTGDELVEPQFVPGQAQIRNSNASQLMAQLTAVGAKAVYGGIIGDNEQDTYEKINGALQHNQVLILSGGISMGDFDYVPVILKEMGMEILFRTIAVQPGKPTVFARSGSKFVFALPGNPVSSFNIFELLAKPFLYRLMGHEYHPAVLRLPLGIPYKRKAINRLGFAPAYLDASGRVFPIMYHGSAHISALTNATAFLQIPLGVELLSEGEMVDVRLV